MERKIICKQCGSVNILGQISENEDFIPCEIPANLDWFLPMQKTKSDTRDPIYTDQQGRSMSRKQYIRVHNIDPDIAQEKMKCHIAMYIGD